MPTSDEESLEDITVSHILHSKVSNFGGSGAADAGVDVSYDLTGMVRKTGGFHEATREAQTDGSNEGGKCSACRAGSGGESF